MSSSHLSSAQTDRLERTNGKKTAGLGRITHKLLLCSIQSSYLFDVYLWYTGMHKAREERERIESVCMFENSLFSLPLLS